MTTKIVLSQIVGTELEDEFQNFDLTEIQNVLGRLADTDAIDLAHAELLQQQALRGADILSEHLAKIVKTTTFLESKMNAVKNKASLDYKAPDGSKVTADMRKWAGESSPEVEKIATKLAFAKGSKAVLEKKYDILIKAHHFYKDLSLSIKKSIVSPNTVAAGWE